MLKKIIKLLLLVLCMTMIFYFSHETGANSSNTSNIVVEIIFNIIKPLLDANITLNIFTEMFGGFIRELAHFSEFMLLGIIAYINVLEYFDLHRFIYTLLFCVMYAISDEIHQYFIPNRVCSIEDILIDTLGALVGLLFIHQLTKRCLKKN